MSSKHGKLIGVLSIAAGIFLTVFSGGTLAVVGKGLIVAGLGLIAADKARKSLEASGALQRSTPTADQNALGSYIFGTTLVPMSMVYEEITGAIPDRVLHDVYAHAWHRIESYQTLTIGTDAGPKVVTFSGNAATGSYSNLLWWFRAVGTQVAALSGTPFDNNSWPSTAIFAGVAHSGLVWNIDDDNFKNKFTSVPEKIEAEVEGAWLYDPRLDPTYGSGSQDYGTPSTWSFNDGNDALVLLRVLIGEYAGSSLVWGRGAAETDIDMASFITAANVADESLDGDVRYRMGGMWLLSGSFEEFVQQWEAETGGKLSKSGGQYRVWLPNDDLTPLTTITEADVVQGSAIQHTIAGGLEVLYNTARGRYIDPDNGYTGKPYAEVSEASAVTADGGKRPMSIDFAWVQSEAIAQRTARTAVRRSRFQRVWVVPMGWKGQSPNYAVFSVHNLNCLETNYTNQLVRVIDRKMSYMGLTVLTLQQEDVSIYDDTVALEDPLAGNNVTSKSSQLRTYGPPDSLRPAAILCEDPFFNRRAQMAAYDLAEHPGYYWATSESHIGAAPTAIIDTDGGSSADKGALLVNLNGGGAAALVVLSLPTERQLIVRGEQISVTVRMRRTAAVGAGTLLYFKAGRGYASGEIIEYGSFGAATGDNLAVFGEPFLSALTINQWYDFQGVVQAGNPSPADGDPDANKFIIGILLSGSNSASFEIDSIVPKRTASAQQIGLIIYPTSTFESAVGL